MDYRFDLQETQQNILEKCPEWTDLMNVVEFKNSPGADPTGYSDKTVYYNSRSMRQFPQGAQAYLIAQQLMHIQLAHQQRGKGRDRKIWDLACAAVVNELLLADGFEPPVNIFRQKDAKTLSAEEMYSVLYEKAERDESELTEEEKSSEEESDVTVLIPVQNKDKNRQAGDMQGAYPVPHAEILLDTSASIDKDLLRAFVRAVKDLLREDAVVRVGCFDTEFYGFQEIHSEKDIATLEIKGAGGTNFETAVKAFTGDAETKIVFTDGYADMPETRCDAIWLVYSDMPVDPPGGKVIYVKKPEEINKYEIDFLVT